jgi:hypothetical protein
MDAIEGDMEHRAFSVGAVVIAVLSPTRVG